MLKISYYMRPYYMRNDMTDFVGRGNASGHAHLILVIGLLSPVVMSIFRVVVGQWVYHVFFW